MSSNLDIQTLSVLPVSRLRQAPNPLQASGLNSDQRWFTRFGALLLVLSLGTACSKGHQADKKLVSLVGEDPASIIEGYLEFDGPSSHWNGPQGFLVHLGFMKMNQPMVSVLPSLSFMGVVPSRLKVEEIKKTLKALQVESEKPLVATGGECWAPVHLKLVQNNGVLVERQGCRGQSGWPTLASQIADDVMSDQANTQPIKPIVAMAKVPTAVTK